MVIQRTLQGIENLKERPHDERRAVAAMIAIGIVAILFIGWTFLFFRRIGGTGPVEAVRPDIGTQMSASAAAARAQMEAAYASTTDGFVDVGQAALDAQAEVASQEEMPADDF